MSSTYVRAFRPLGNNRTVNIVTTTLQQLLVIPDSPLGTRSIRIANVGTDLSFIELSAVGEVSSVPTVTTSMPLLPNSVEVFTFPNDRSAVRIIGLAGGNTVYVTHGEGL